MYYNLRSWVLVFTNASAIGLLRKVNAGIKAGPRDQLDFCVLLHLVQVVSRVRIAEGQPDAGSLLKAVGGGHHLKLDSGGLVRHQVGRVRLIKRVIEWNIRRHARFVVGGPLKRHRVVGLPVPRSEDALGDVVDAAGSRVEILLRVRMKERKRDGVIFLA